MSDVHVGAHNATPPIDGFFVWLDGIPESNRPRYVYVLGDLADHGQEGEQQKFVQLFVEPLEARGIPVYRLLGNHDIYYNSFANWKKYHEPGTSFYRMRTDNLSWYAIDTASGLIGDKQLRLLLEAFRNDPNPKVVVTHNPISPLAASAGIKVLCDLSDTKERNLFFEYCAQYNVKRIYSGHMHPPKVERHNPLGPLFTECILTSFNYKREWLFVQIDESTATFTEEVVSADKYTR